jgi:hypothetical protein
VRRPLVDGQRQDGGTEVSDTPRLPSGPNLNINGVLLATGFLPYALAFGLSPSGEPVPIRVDEDGYVLVKVSTVVGTHGSKQ